MRSGLKLSCELSLTKDLLMNALVSRVASACVAAALVPSFALPANAEEPPMGSAGDAPASVLARKRDASVDRGVTTGHAETIGKGNWSINSYELFLIGATYGISDDFQISATTLLPIFKNLPFVFALAPKFVVNRGAQHALAIRGDVWVGVDGDTTLGRVSVGPVLDYFFDRQGRFALHAGLNIGGVFGGIDGSGGISFAEGLLIGLDLGFTLGVAKGFKLIVEGQVFAGYSAAGFNVAEVALVNYGVRFHGESLAVDLTFLRPVGDFDVGPLVMGVPFVAFSARF
jgi:hypothetical protein